MEDNLSRQLDEIEALAAIYSDEWCVIDSAHRVYCISVNDNERKLSLHISLPEDYPSSSPPQYSLNAPWLRGQAKTDLGRQLEEIYCDNMGESIIHLWVEHMREFLTSYEASDTKTEEEESTEDASEFIQFEPGPDEMPSTGTVSLPEIFHGETIHDRRSVFQGYLAQIHHKNQVDLFVNALKECKKIANATHNIVAYRIRCDVNGRETLFQGCDDDGETHAGSRMLHLMQIVDAVNVVVMVSRWYGGVLLGPDRFKHINNCCRQLLDEHGFIQSKDAGKSKSSKNHKK